MMLLCGLFVSAAMLALAVPAAQLGRLPAVGAKGPDLRSRRWQGRLLRRSSGRVAADPLADAASFDLFAACVSAGMPIGAAAKVVARSASAGLSIPLQNAAERLALGADPMQAWATDDDAGPAMAALTSMMRRSARAGTSPTEGLAELAAAQRESVGDHALERAERAGVAISGPLGLCFLPAFICLGIVPVVVGLTGQVLGNGLL